MRGPWPERALSMLSQTEQCEFCSEILWWHNSKTLQCPEDSKSPDTTFRKRLAR